MENIDHMGRDSLTALSRDNLTDRGRRKLTREILCGAATLICLCVGLLYTYLSAAHTKSFLSSFTSRVSLSRASP